MRVFDVNSAFIYGVALVVVAFVLAQSAYFLYRATERAKELKMSTSLIKDTIWASSFFSLAPSLAILIGVISLSAFLGLPWPWLRLSVLGAVTYELPAAAATAKAMALEMTQYISDPHAFTAIAWVMTLGIIPGIFIVLFRLPQIQKGITTLKAKDAKWGDAVLTSLFLGMISAFLGLLFARVREGLPGFVPIVVALVSAIFMGICGYFIRVKKATWLEQYALPISMLAAMALSIPITAWMR